MRLCASVYLHVCVKLSVQRDEWEAMKRQECVSWCVLCWWWQLLWVQHCPLEIRRRGHGHNCRTYQKGPRTITLLFWQPKTHHHTHIHTQAHTTQAYRLTHNPYGHTCLSRFAQNIHRHILYAYTTHVDARMNEHGRPHWHAQVHAHTFAKAHSVIADTVFSFPNHSHF